MMKIKRIAAGALVLSLLLSACIGQAGSENSAPVDASGAEASTGSEEQGESSAAAAELGYVAEMDKNTVMTFDISVDPDDWQDMLDNAADKEYISADVTINGTTIENVGIRPKGNSSLSSVARDDTTDRYSFKIKFGEYEKGQTWLGLDKMVLNNNFSDATSMKEYLSYDIMSSIGVDASLFAYANITVNGETWGFYLAVEDLEDSYLDRAQDGEGSLYKPETMDMNGMGGGRERGDREGEGFTPPEGMEEMDWENFAPPEGGGGFPGGGGGMGGMDNGVSLVYTDDEISSYSAIFDNNKTKTSEEDNQRVIEAIKNLNEGTDLETYVDVDAVLRYLAAHTVVVNLDSYSSNLAHNYVLYENDGQISMLPWDYNMAFGGFHSSDASSVVNFPIDTPVSGVSMEDRPMIAKLLEVPEYLERYHQYLQEIVDGYFSDGTFEEKVDELDAMIADYIEKDPTAFYTYDEYKDAIAELKKLGALRGESVQGQLDGSVPSTTEGQAAEPEKLIDASSVDLSRMGGGFGGGGDGFPRNREAGQQAAPEEPSPEEPGETEDERAG